MKRFSNILFVAEPGATDGVAFGRAVALANNNQAQFTLIGLVHGFNKDKLGKGTRESRLLQVMIEDRQEKLHSLAKKASESGLKVKFKVLVGTGFIEIIREVLRNKRDLVIKSVEDPNGFGQALFAGTDAKLLRKCPCPLWLIKPDPKKHYRQILVAVEYDPENALTEALNQRILEMATSLALSEFAELHIVHAWVLEDEYYLRSQRYQGYVRAEVDRLLREEGNDRRRWLESLVDKHCGVHGKFAIDYLRPNLHLVKGDARHVVPSLVSNLAVELVVMGTVLHTGIPGFLIGNTAERILNQISCSALTIKPAGFVSSVTLGKGES